MKTTIQIDSFKDDFDYATERAVQTPCTEDVEVAICDCCEEEIIEGKNIDTGFDNDFCVKCYESGGISRYMRKFILSPEELLHEMNQIKTKYEKITNGKAN